MSNASRGILQSIPQSEIERRQLQIVGQLSKISAGCVVLHSPANIQFFSGFETVSTATYACCILSAHREPSLIVWHLEEAAARAKSWIGNVLTYATGEDPIAVTLAEIGRHLSGDGTIALELDAVGLPPAGLVAIQAAYGAGRLANATPLVANVRRVKSEFEIDCFHKAATMTDVAMRAAIEAAAMGATDNAIGAAASESMLRSGSEYSCMPPIVSAGVQAGIAHSTFSNLALERGDLVVIELGACVSRYCTPLMRTVAIGQPSSAARGLFDVACSVLDRMINEVRPGRIAGDVAEVGWSLMQSPPPDLAFHGIFGYGVGSGFPPSWSDGTMRVWRGSRQEIKPGMVLHLPIAFRRPGQFGVAVSETIVVGPDRNEVLGNVPRDLAIR